MIEAESKMIVYTLLAITLGYLLISTVPGQLAPPLYEGVLSETEDSREIGPDESQPSVEEAPETLGDSSALTATSPASTAGEVASGLSGGYTMLVGTLIVNLSIAFGVYMLARRRFG
ncbi:MAG: hypothetical protein JSV18_00490 [Candidatus Bathyarchaeota archaeon]|nr:MAG: hypothetical protein JSV18_00490 [Candidatus Bathyarchaeota archaeon]